MFEHVIPIYELGFVKYRPNDIWSPSKPWIPPSIFVSTPI